MFNWRCRQLVPGQKFGKWTVTKFVGKTAAKHALLWECECMCGLKRLVVGSDLLRGKSLGCRNCAHKFSTHGEAKHGRRSPEWLAWMAMKNRCYNSKNISYADYGNRGIKVCDRWRESYRNFLADMGRKPNKYFSIDRINVNGNYEPDNCRWVDAKQQSRNKRSNVMLTHNGTTQCLRDWSIELGVDYNLLHLRHIRGWTDERILNTPKGKYVRIGTY